MNETLFYVLGIGLVVVALVVSFVGLRSRSSRLAGAAGRRPRPRSRRSSAATGAFAWLNAEDEQEHREAELAEAAEENAAEDEEAEAAEEVGQRRPPRSATTRRASADGAGRQGRSSSRPRLRRLSHARRRRLDRDDRPRPRRRAKGQGRGLHRTSIVDPNAEVAKGYPPDVMPQTFGDDLSPEELDALVQYLIESTSGQS